jgi:3-demethoxyubiquinol 3-hydroxylase
MFRLTTITLRSCVRHSRTLTTAAPSAAYFSPTKASDPSVTSSPENLTPEQRETLHASLRVDQAGELAADYIYRGQLAILGRDPSCGRVIKASTRHVTKPVILTQCRKCGSKNRNI